MSLHLNFQLALPEWLDSCVENWPEPLASVEQRMRLAVKLSAENVRHGTGGPFGAIVIEDRNSRLLGVGVNLVTTLELSIAHAEMVAISLAQSAIGNWNLGAKADVQLVTSCEPCAMCFGAIVQARIDRLVFGAYDPKAGAAGSAVDLSDSPAFNHRFEIQGGVLADECGVPLKEFFQGRR